MSDLPITCTKVTGVDRPEGLVVSVKVSGRSQVEGYGQFSNTSPVTSGVPQSTVLRSC